MPIFEKDEPITLEEMARQQRELNRKIKRREQERQEWLDALKDMFGEVNPQDNQNG